TIMTTVRIETERGHRYDLSVEAVKRLKAARGARDAEDAFEGFAGHVARADRVDVWFAVDNVEV
ncbi:MAG: hypothetical protein ACYS0H_22950, partial [Planctomycetota bacterium]